MEQQPNKNQESNSFMDRMAEAEKKRQEAINKTEAAKRGAALAEQLNDSIRKQEMMDAEISAQHEIAVAEGEIQRLHAEAVEKALGDPTNNVVEFSATTPTTEESYDFGDDREANRMDKRKAA